MTESLSVWLLIGAAVLQTWCRCGEVFDAKTLAGALWLEQVLRGDWRLDWFSSAAAAGAG